jgi:hypothetical protein
MDFQFSDSAKDAGDLKWESGTGDSQRLSHLLADRPVWIDHSLKINSLDVQDSDFFDGLVQPVSDQEWLKPL